ncbi:MAG: hypothetical protein ABWY25_10235 [Paenisporosarcina sp.]
MADKFDKAEDESKRFNPGPKVEQPIYKPTEPSVPPTTKPVEPAQLPADPVGLSPEKLEVLHNIQATLKEYKLQESEIPTSHPYWTWLGQYRAMK